jgi:tetrahydromethanopterin S-methyltransferase subunit G
MEERIVEALNSLTNRLNELEQKIDCMTLMYRPLGRDEHMNITEYLDEVEERIKCLEE